MERPQSPKWDPNSLNAYDPVSGEMRQDPDLDAFERAQRAVSNFRTLIPALTGYARAITKNPKTQVVLSPGSPCTDGINIFMRPPPELGDTLSHEREICTRRDADGILACDACRRSEEIGIILRHEVAHIIFDSFEALDPADKVDAITNALREANVDPADTTREAKIRDRIDKYLSRKGADSYMGAATAVSPWLPAILNALEDARVNTSMYKARPGTYKQFKAQSTRILNEGIEDDVGGVQHWRDRTPDAQAIVGLFVKAAGYDYADVFVPEVVAALDDTDLDAIVREVQDAKSVRQVYRVGYRALEVLRKHGFCKTQDDLEDEPEPQPTPDVPKELKQQDARKPQEDSDQSNVDSGQESELGEGQAGEGADTESGNESQAGDAEGDGSGDGSSESGSSAPSGPSIPDNSSNAPSSTPSWGDDDGEDSDSDNDGSSEGSSEDDDAESGADSSAGEQETEADASAGESDTDDDADDAEDGDADDSEGGDAGHATQPTERRDDFEPDEDDEDDGLPPWGDDQDDGESTYDPNAAADQDFEWKPPEYVDGLAEAEEALREISGHKDFDGDPPGSPGVGDAGDGPPADPAKSEIDRAIIQADFFDAPSRRVWTANVWEDPNDKENPAPGWARGSRIQTPLELPPEALLAPALKEMRVTFSDNKKARHKRNLKSGRVSTKSLSRVAVDDYRVFKKKLEPAAKDYFVVIGFDCSGSTASGAIHLLKASAMAQAELLHRAGVPFAVYAHSANNSGPGRELCADIHVVKSPADKWDAVAKDRLSRIYANGGNVDGHNLEFYRKIATSQHATERLVMYYTDGAMPAANREEELEILQREIRDAPKHRVKIVGIGVGTDSPRQHGLDTITVFSMEDVPKVVRELKSRLSPGGVPVSGA